MTSSMHYVVEVKITQVEGADEPGERGIDKRKKHEITHTVQSAADLRTAVRRAKGVLDLATDDLVEPNTAGTTRRVMKDNPQA